jgi:hypothetical protein
MKRLAIVSLIIAPFLPLSAIAAGLAPWQLGMSKSDVASFKEFAPYKQFSNGDLETDNGRFHGQKANVQFFFQAERLRRIGVYLYEGTDPKGGIPAWRSAYEALRKDYGELSVPDIHVGAGSDPVNADVLAIAAAANTDVTGETRMLPTAQPAGMHVSARFWSGNVQGRKWYYVTVFYDVTGPSGAASR